MNSVSWRRNCRRAAMALSGTLFLGAVGTPLLGQRAPVMEGRVTLISARVTTAAAGAAMSFGTAGYTRFTMIGALGNAWSGDELRNAAHADVIVRFYLDPYRASPWGVYGSGGLSALYDGFNAWRGALVASAGVEFPSRGRAAWAAEMGLGGGLRFTIALRQAPERRR